MFLLCIQRIQPIICNEIIKWHRSKIKRYRKYEANKLTFLKAFFKADSHSVCHQIFVLWKIIPRHVWCIASMGVPHWFFIRSLLLSDQRVLKEEQESKNTPILKTLYLLCNTTCLLNLGLVQARAVLVKHWLSMYTFGILLSETDPVSLQLLE